LVSIEKNVGEEEKKKKKNKKAQKKRKVIKIKKSFSFIKLLEQYDEDILLTNHSIFDFH